MKKSNCIKLFKFSIEKVLKKYRKWFFKMCGELCIYNNTSEIKGYNDWELWQNEKS